MKTLLYVLYAVAAALLVVFAFLIFTSHSHAGSCGTVYFPQTYAPSVIYKDNHHDDYIEKKRVVVLEYSLFPAFPVGFMPQYAPAAAPSAAPPPQAVGASTPCDDKLKGLEAKIAALESKLGGGVPPNALPNTAPAPVVAKVFVAKCAGCHDASTAAAKGKNLTLFKDGAPIAWNAELTGKVLKEVAKGTMPKGGKLAQDEFASLAQELFDLSSK